MGMLTRLIAWLMPAPQDWRQVFAYEAALLGAVLTLAVVGLGLGLLVNHRWPDLWWYLLNGSILVLVGSLTVYALYRWKASSRRG